MTEPAWVEDYFAPPGPAITEAGTGTLNDVATTEDKRARSRMRFTGVAPTVNGLASGRQGRKLSVYAIGGPLVLANENAGSLAANRIVTGTGADLTILQGAVGNLEYDEEAQRWRVAAGGSGGGGTGSGSNVGGGAEIFKDVSGGALRHRTLEPNTSNTVSTAAGKSYEQKANTVVSRVLPPGHVNAADFGTLDPEGVNDCLATIRAAIVTAKQHLLIVPGGSWKAGGVVHLPPGNYRMSGKLLIDGSIRLQGPHNGGGDWGTANLQFDENLSDDALIELRSVSTDGTSTNGNFTGIHDIQIIQTRSSARDFRKCLAGILVQANGCTIHNVELQQVQGDGIVIGKQVNHSDFGNANCAVLSGKVRVMQADRYGLHFGGTESNAGGVVGVLDVEACGSYGISNRSFLGEHIECAHTTSNGAIVASGLWYWRGSFDLNAFAPGLGVWSAGATVPAGKPYIPTIANCPLPHLAFIVVSNGGTTGGTEPDWSQLAEVGDTIVDGTVTWTAYGEIGGCAKVIGTNNRSTIGYLYMEADQNPVHAPDGGLAIQGGPYEITPESRVIQAQTFYRQFPSRTWCPGRKTDGTVIGGVELGVGRQGSPYEAWNKSADTTTTSTADDPPEWTFDWGRIREIWEPTLKRWRREAFHPQGPMRYTSFTEVGFRAMPLQGAICWTSFFLGGKVGEEKRMTSLPAKATAPYSPDFSSIDAGASGCFDEQDVVLNQRKSGRPSFPFAWRAKQKNSRISSGDPYAASGWIATSRYFVGQVIQDATAFYRVIEEGDGLASNPKPAFADTPGTEYTEAGGLKWQWAGSTTIVDLDAWEPLIDRAPTSLTKSVAGSSNVTLTADESAHARFKFTGALTANIYVVIDPGGANGWDVLVENATTGDFSLTVKCTSGGAGVVVAKNATTHLAADGTDVKSVGRGPATTVAVAAFDIDWSKGDLFTKTLAAGANTFTFSNVASGQTIRARLASDPGTSTVAWPSSVRWPGGGTAPTQTPTGTDLYEFTSDGIDVFGSVKQDYGTPADPLAGFAANEYQQNYLGTSPWSGTASTGSSGTNAASGVGGSEPGLGTPVNGLGTAAFNGSANKLQLTEDVQTTFGPASSAMSGWHLIDVNAIATNDTSVNGYINNVCILGTVGAGGGYFQVYLRGTGGSWFVGVTMYNGTGNYKTVECAISLSTLTLVHWEFDAGVLRIGTNGTWPGGAATLSVSGTLDAAANTMALALGKCDSGAYLDADLVGSQLFASGIAANLASIVTAVNAKWGTSF